MNLRLLSTLVITSYANDVDALVPEVWAAEALMVLNANMIMGNLVHRDFENEIAQQGDVVNTRRPAKFTAKRKGVNDSVTVQDATLTNVAVPLNQHLHTSFLIRDGEESRSMKSLVDTFLVPGVMSIAQQIDRIVYSQAYRFMKNGVGALGTAVTKSTVTAVGEKMNQLLAPQGGRNLIVTPSQQNTLLNISDFTNASAIGDTGSALREGSLGRKFGLDIFMSQNAPGISSITAARTGAINNAGGYAAGTTGALAVDGFVGQVPVGAIVNLAGRMYIVTARGADVNTISVTLDRGLDIAVVDNAVMDQGPVGAVNKAGNYAAGYDGTIVADGGAIGLVGLPTSFGTNIYGQIEGTTSTGLILDRPSLAALADDSVIGQGLNGQYGFAFHRNAISLVTRPLAQPRAGAGALSAVANANGIGVRVVMTYDGDKQGHLVTIDLLAGVEVLDLNLGVPFYG